MVFGFFGYLVVFFYLCGVVLYVLLDLCDVVL